MTKILAIDDKMDNLVTLSALLNNLMPECSVTTAQSGVKGIEKASSEFPDAILLDVRMPDVDGFETCRRLKSDESTKHIPVIMITAIETDTQSRIKGLKLGADAFLSKPIDPYELISQVKVALRIKKAEDTLREERDSLERLVEERTAALVEVKESARDFLERVINSIADPVFVKDDKRRLVLVNDALCAMVGCPREGLLGKDGDDMFPKGEVAVFRETDAAVLDTGEENVNEELLSNLSTGEVRTIVTRKTRYIDPNGNHFLVGVIRDITERKLAEETLKKNEKKYRQMFETNMAIKLIINPQDGSIVNANEAACHYYGYSKQEMLALKIKDINILPPEEIDAEMQKAKNEDQLRFNFSHRLASGEVRDVEVYSGPIDLGGETVLYSIIHDITDRVKAEKKNLENEAHYRLLFNSVNDPIFLVDTETMKLIDANETAVNFYGYSYEELLQKKATDLSVETEKTRASLQKGFTNIPVRYHRKKDGTVIPVEITATYFKYNHRKVNLSNIRDISERLDKEKEREEIESKLRQAQKMESIGNLAGGIAHDFNNILSSVIGFTELSLDEVEKGTHIEDNLQEVYAAGTRAKDLVRQILAFARQSEEKIKPIQVDTIATEVLKFIRSSIPTTIEIKQNIESDSLIMGNATQVYQILMNLFTNAAQAMENNGGVLGFSLKDIVVDRGVNLEKIDLKPGNYIEVKVSDTGVGIAPEIIGTIFDPYFTTKGPGEGTGMGLAMVHGIIGNYGGKISVDSKPGQGTLFTIYLPITRKRQSHNPYQAETLPVGKERILFVDDEASIAKMSSQVLGHLGYSVTNRTSSVEALELFRSKPNDFDLVITDMTMPNMTGDKLVIELMKIRPDIPVILCTGYSKKISDESAAEIGINAFAYKPIVKADLAKTVRKVLDEANG